MNPSDLASFTETKGPGHRLVLRDTAWLTPLHWG